MAIDMTNFPYEYVNEIWDIAHANGNVSWDIGLDMFINNIDDIELHKQGKDQYWYGGADNIPYEELHAATRKMGDVEVVRRKRIYRTVYAKKAITDYAELVRSGKREELKELFISDVNKYLETNKC